MKISYAQAFQAAPALNILANKPYTAGFAIKLVDIIDQLNPHLVAIERFKESLTLSATEDVSADKLNEEFVNYLNATTAEVEFTPIYPEEADAAGLAFTVREMAAVRFMFAKPLPGRKQ